MQNMKINSGEVRAHNWENASGLNLVASLNPLFPLGRALASLGWFVEQS